MIVGVRNWDGAADITYYNLPSYSDQFSGDRDKARQIAYRFNRRQNEPDFNALVHQTIVIEPQTIPIEVVQFIAGN